MKQILASALPPLYRVAYRILGNAADAEDALQDALLVAYTHLDQFRGQAQISTWLTAILLNCARLQLRRRPRHIHVSIDESSEELQPVSVSERLADNRPSPEDRCRDSELWARLTHLNRQLSPTLRRTFQLREVEGLSIRETARILGVPTGTVKAQSARARKKLKELMRRPSGHDLEGCQIDCWFCKSGTPCRRSRVTLMVHEVVLDSECDRAAALVLANGLP